MKSGQLRFAILCLIPLVFFGKSQARYSYAYCFKLVDTVKRDIPVDKKGNKVLSYISKVRATSLLKLDTLENGFDSLQIRIWYGYARIDSGQLFVLKNVNGKWNAEMLTLVYHMSRNEDSLLSIGKSSISGEPKSGWISFYNRLFKLKVMSLPDMRKISNYPDIADGNGISIETAIISKYRYYSYQEPIYAQERVKEARNIEQILELIESEFDFKRLRKL